MSLKPLIGVVCGELATVKMCIVTKDAVGSKGILHARDKPTGYFLGLSRACRMLETNQKRSRHRILDPQRNSCFLAKLINTGPDAQKRGLPMTSSNECRSLNEIWRAECSEIVDVASCLHDLAER